MADTLATIRARRSVRKFKPDMIPEDVLDQVLEAGTWAPTGMGRQSPVILCVTDKAVRDELARMNREIMIETGMDVKRGMDPFYGAPVVCVVLADAQAPTGRDDGNLVHLPCQGGVRAPRGQGDPEEGRHRRRLRGRGPRDLGLRRYVPQGRPAQRRLHLQALA